ncbi:glutamate--cysteine ligase [Rubrivirga sp. S365]|uniref:Putative glutamate--cysteine ligase 2 n=1 Tax=Rubrivirga litoralis TaxID=3075598 RepID=A0ABU3BMM2_9BACT|nr:MULTISPECIES: glutamate--cysteine ligase [unclassified Rubrivirga]MDT0630533.1 glutamate--cysteine ligase [Rubrivirga sp. F394]MDT7856852.1 glutamate--cysteine ligase [Rubrivirga sp. S365]
MDVSSANALAPIPFQGSPEPTLGVEVELQIVDPSTFNLKQGSVALLDRVGRDHPKIKQELTQSTVEVITGICTDVGHCVRDLSESVRELYAHSAELGLAFSSAGTHPFGQWRDQKIFPNDRYQGLVDRIQWPARRLLIYGLHVHVGVSSGEKAIAVSNALSSYLPHLLALSASSPFTDFEDTGLASARSKIFEGMPTAGLPYRLANYGEFQSFMNTLVRAGAIQTIREIWWDIRPHPNFGTLEVRICDSPSTMEELAALVALTQCLVVALGERYDTGAPLRLLDPWILRENKWRACRHGLDADVIRDNEGDHAPLREQLPDLVAKLEPVADRLGCLAELRGVHRVLESGASYERQRRTYAATQRLPDVVASLADEFRESVEAAPA